MADAAAEDTHRTLLDILDQGSRACPYGRFDRIRAEEPVWVADRPVVVFGSRAACEAVLRHPHASNERSHALLFQNQPSAGSGAAAEIPSFLFMDAPRHTRLRRLAARAFTPAVVRGLEPMLKELVDDLIDTMTADDEIDLIDTLASPLPVTVICRMLGAELDDPHWYRRRSSLLGQAVDPFPAFAGVPAPGREQRQRAEAELTTFFTELVGRRRLAPKDDLVSMLIAAELDGDRLTEHELVTTCRLILNAGHETTVNLLGNGLLALLRSPARLAALRADPGLAEKVVEETLRFDPSLQMVHRHAREEMDVLGTRIPRGTTMVLILAAAHRDPAVIVDPGRFDPTRPDAEHLGFGLGMHFCLGASLARLEGKLAFARFAQRVLEPTLGEAPLRYRQNVILRGLEALPVSAGKILPRATPWPQ